MFDVLAWHFDYFKPHAALCKTNVQHWLAVKDEQLAAKDEQIAALRAAQKDEEGIPPPSSA